jgi:hypothetical protein
MRGAGPPQLETRRTMIAAAQVHGQFALHDIVLSPQEVFFQRIAVGRHGRIADIRIL